MISDDVFESEFVEFLCCRFEEPATDRLFDEYREFFDDRGYTDEQFREICKRVFREWPNRLMPSPAYFHEMHEAIEKEKRLAAVPTIGPSDPTQNREWQAQSRFYQEYFRRLSERNNELPSSSEPKQLPAAEQPNTGREELSVLELQRYRPRASGLRNPFS